MSFAVAAEASRAPMPVRSGVPKTKLVVSSDMLLEEGKALFESGQYIAAMGKFMMVLRREPHQPEARQYLRMVIDEMRQNPGLVASKSTKAGQASVPSAVAQEELRQQLRQRALFTLDLKAIPGVRLNLKKGSAQVEVDTALLFAENSGGLKEQGIPILDRVSAWLKTYGQQPVIIHCYPEELQDPTANSSLFLRRYSELYSFFVDERKLPPQRFVSADLLTSSPPNASVGGPSSKGTMDSPPEAAGNDDNKTPHVVIETLGSQTVFLEAMPSGSPRHALSRWLELSVMATRSLFNPEEGEWVSLDIAALTRTGLRSWIFKVMPAEMKKGSDQPVMYMEGKGNLLKRLSWDGHDGKSGSFVPAGSYVAKLVATDSDGTIMNREVALQVLRTTVEEPVVVVKKSGKRKAVSVERKAKSEPQEASVPQVTSAPKPSTSFPAATGGESSVSTNGVDRPPTKAFGGDSGGKATTTVAATEDEDSLIGSEPVAAATGGQTPSPEVPAAEDSVDSVHAIWKQVVQFEPNQSDLKPTVKASLERIGKTLEVYPLQKVRIMGFAMASEPNAAALARERAETVQSILVEQYHVDKKRVIVAGGKTIPGENGSKVEMSITN